MIQNYEDFTEALLHAGFSMAGGSADGIYAIINWIWNEPPPYPTPIAWHTGDQATDPWQWRMRVLNERSDIAYAKIFNKKSGFVTETWYPYFLAARRKASSGHIKSFEEAHAAGEISHDAKRLYQTLTGLGILPSDALKAEAGYNRESKSAFDRALTELQMKMYITMCGCQQKFTKKGEEYGMPATVFCSTENFFGSGVFEEAARLSRDEAVEAIMQQVLMLNPNAEEKKIAKFIFG